MVRYAFDTIRYNQRNLMDDSENNINTYKMIPVELEQAFKDRVRRYNRLREQREKEAIT